MSLPHPLPATTSVPPGPRDERATQELAHLFEQGGALILSGAGLSTESGIPDYRGPDGQRRVTPMQYGEFVASSAARQRYWARSYLGWTRFSRARPNAGHAAVARLGELGLLGGIITQNVDGLHQEAGARGVVELHGSLDRVVCLTCGSMSRRETLQQRMQRGNDGFDELALGVAGDGSRVSSQIRPDGDIVIDEAAVAGFVPPRCLQCGSDTLKPDVVFFGESVPKPRVEHCFALVEAASSLVVLGSSLAVMSGFRFVRRAAKDGVPVAIATASPTRGDELARVRVSESLGTLLPRVVDLLGG